MMKTSNSILDNERGATIVYVAIILGVLVMFTALAIDVGHLYGVRNELQDAADAGALAGASVLFDNDTGELRAPDASDEAIRVVNLNKTGGYSVVAKTVEIGHWSFNNPAHTFQSAGENPEQLEGWQEMSASDLDGNSGYINAVRVVTERADTPSFFANIFGYDKFIVNTEAVAYRGFAGRFEPGDFDQPIAICYQSITAEGKLECNVGRMINSGSDSTSSNTGAWTNFTQPCDTANTPTVSPLVCATGNTTEVDSGEGIGTTGGQIQNIFSDLMTCWEKSTNKTRNWPLLLPVVDCPGNNVSNCATLKSGVSLNIIWMIDNIPQSENNKYDDVPRYMETWEMIDGEFTKIDSKTFSKPISEYPDNFEVWKDFVDHFNLTNLDGSPNNRDDNDGYSKLYQHKAIYFLPNCQFAEPTGSTGDTNTGVVSRTPVLVQ